MRRLAALAALVPAPALAAEEYGLLSLRNSDFVVLLAFLLFIGILVYFRVPQRLAGLLDRRAEGIRSEIDEARALREEAQTLLASYERKSREVQAQADRIVEQARAEARDQARRDLEAQVARRIEGATRSPRRRREVIAERMDASLVDQDRAVQATGLLARSYERKSREVQAPGRPHRRARPARRRARPPTRRAATWRPGRAPHRRSAPSSILELH